MKTPAQKSKEAEAYLKSSSLTGAQILLLRHANNNFHYNDSVVVRTPGIARETNGGAVQTYVTRSETLAILRKRGFIADTYTYTEDEQKIMRAQVDDIVGNAQHLFCSDMVGSVWEQVLVELQAAKKLLWQANHKALRITEAGRRVVEVFEALLFKPEDLRDGPIGGSL